MNSISTSKLPGKILGNLAFAGSLILHVGLIGVFSSWQWNWKTTDKNPPQTIQVKFFSPANSPQSTETPDALKPTLSASARPLALQSDPKVHLKPRPSTLSIPNVQTVARTPQSFQKHGPSIKRPLAQPTSLTHSKLISAVSPVKSTQHTQRTAIHHRPPASEIHLSKIPDIPGQTAFVTGPAQPKSKMIRLRPFAVRSMAPSQVDFASQVVAEPLTSQKTERDIVAALPRELPQNLLMNRDDSDADLNGLRGLFTGKVRQRIANAKYYPRIARRRGMEGQPIIAFTLDKTGRLMKVDLAQTSGYQLLDQAAVRAVHQAEPYPEIPDELKTDTLHFKLPISFVLK